jgi:tetratricopeptide (TPR) repeat protein
VHYVEAAALTSPVDGQTGWRYRLRTAGALADLGAEFGDNGALLEAIAAYRAVLGLAPRERVPLDWAMTQNNLGTALRTLGQRESGTARLEEAVAAWNDCLEITASILPAQWVSGLRARRDEVRAEIERRSVKLQKPIRQPGG